MARAAERDRWALLVAALAERVEVVNLDLVGRAADGAGLA
jgi:hypothetical protein